MKINNFTLKVSGVLCFVVMACFIGLFTLYVYYIQGDSEPASIRSFLPEKKIYHGSNSGESDCGTLKNQEKGKHWGQFCYFHKKGRRGGYHSMGLLKRNNLYSENVFLSPILLVL